MPRRIRKSRKVAEVEKIALNHEEISEINVEPQEEIFSNVQNSTGYFEFHDLDLKPSQEDEDSKEKVSDTDLIASSTRRSSFPSQIFSRKIKLLIRKAYLVCELKSAQIFVTKQLTNNELTALALSCVPPHILRIFDPVIISEGKTLKNSLAMFATWWKNNFGSRIVQIGKQNFKISPFNKVFELKSALLTKSAYEDDLVRLFTIICYGLGLKIRFIHSLDLIPATVVKTATDNSKAFKHVPRYWLEVYSNLDQKWITIDCIQGHIEEKNLLDNKSKPHSFVLAVDGNGLFYDLTEKYSSDYQEKSFKLRKDEDKWLKEFIVQLNLNNNYESKVLIERDSIQPVNESKQAIEIPKTVSAIKIHPILMLETQLKKYEVFYPVTKPFGYFKDEAVFLKENVKKVRSRDAWLSQCARVVKVIIIQQFFDFLPCHALFIGRRRAGKISKLAEESWCSYR